ncbi:MAG: ABC transporter ATP-binding protein, partial [Ktedonobacteraceae bacterium]|nr:ABC transporter ATP-binding protein [Ktedonobacteraceae bacterium]
MLKLLRFLKPYRVSLVVVLLFAFAQSMANLYLPHMMADIVNNGVVKGDTGYIWWVGGLMLLVAIAGVL